MTFTSLLKWLHCVIQFPFSSTPKYLIGKKISHWMSMIWCFQLFWHFFPMNMSLTKSPQVICWSSLWWSSPDCTIIWFNKNRKNKGKQNLKEQDAANQATMRAYTTAQTNYFQELWVIYLAPIEHQIDKLQQDTPF